MLRIFIAVLLMGLCAEGAMAKDLTNRLGVGIKDDTSQAVPALDAVYWLRPDFAVTGGLGIDTRVDTSAFVAQGGVRRVVFREDNMNFYFGGELGLVNYQISGAKQSGFELNALFGGEFFLAGLDSLGFTFEGGLGVVSLNDVRFRTIANTPLTAGIVFYF